MERTYKALIEASHSQAVKSGWWEGGVEARSLDDQFNNFHAEVSESWEEYRAGRMATWYSWHGNPIHPDSDVGPLKPEGFFVELADLLIRLADTCGAYGIELYESAIPDFEDVPAARFIAHCHVAINQLHEVFEMESRRGWFSSFFADCFNYAADIHNVDLWAVIEEKMAYNATRSHRHGGKKA